jgi:phage shock protein E
MVLMVSSFKFKFKRAAYHRSRGSGVKKRQLKLQKKENQAFAPVLQLPDNLAPDSTDTQPMRNIFLLPSFTQNTAALCLTVFTASAGLAQTNSIPNRLIDYPAFLAQAAEVGRVREQHRLTEDMFIQMASEPGTIVFDARSDDKYQKLHIKGACHLSFPEITAEELAKVIPSKSTPVLIYCNNNFLNAPNTFASKQPAASLNIHTFNTLHNYGYTNVYELGPLLDIRKSRLTFEGTQLQSP